MINEDSAFPFPLKFEGQLVAPEAITEEMLFAPFRIINVQARLNFDYVSGEEGGNLQLDPYQATERAKEFLKAHYPPAVVMCQWWQSTLRFNLGPNLAESGFVITADFIILDESRKPIPSTMRQRRENRIRLRKIFHGFSEQPTETSTLPGLRLRSFAITGVDYAPRWNKGTSKKIASFKRQWTKSFQKQLRTQLERVRRLHDPPAEKGT